MSISGLYAEWVRSHKETKDRDPFRLYLSDLGKCPRQIQYRLMNTEPDYVSEQQLINKDLMFRLAEQIEDDVTQMFAERGDLWGFQGPVEIVDRNNWGGRYDIIADYEGKRIIEVKSVHPNTFRYDIDNRPHRLQAWSYHHYLAEAEGLTEYPLLVYFDRGGSNTSQEQVVMPQPVVAVMDELDYARDIVPDLMPQLPKVLMVRDARKTIKLEPDSRCRTPYCPYMAECKPDRKASVWAQRDDPEHPWIPTKKADPERLLPFIDHMIEEIIG